MTPLPSLNPLPLRLLGSYHEFRNNFVAEIWRNKNQIAKTHSKQEIQDCAVKLDFSVNLKISLCTSR